MTCTMQFTYGAYTHAPDAPRLPRLKVAGQERPIGPGHVQVRGNVVRGLGLLLPPPARPPAAAAAAACVPVVLLLS